MPHGHCYFWSGGLVALHSVADAVTALAFYSIPLTFFYFLRRRRDLELHWVFLSFSLLILSCGTTHLLEVWNIWHAAYWTSGAVKAITALVSAPTAVLLLKLVPQALALPSPLQLRAVNETLRQEMAEREKTTESLRISEERFRLLVESVPDYAIFMLNFGGYVTSWNSGAQEQRPEDANSLRLLASVAAQLGAVLERRQAEDEIHRLNAELENRVVRRTGELQTANRELESFSYSISHDLRAPLRAIDGYSLILQEDHAQKLDDEGLRVLGVVRSEARRMGQLVDELLAFSQLGRRTLERKRVDMAALSRLAFDEAAGAGSVGERKITFTVQDLPPTQGDPTLLRQVWANLLSNALKFTREREWTVISIDGSQTGTENTYCVHDNGAGFNMKHAQKLFGVFQRLHTEDEFEGTGVGLAIVQRIVERHGGRIWAEAAVGAGAAFFFSLPLTERDEL